ncbi:MAG TPA: flippase-like domain-containing protein, partial [Candidatus Limosilactobacillus merdipullorum]|nr:flippase-like domain-containing protein [Candidatus Limosilactobacillus merdipullorum]
MSRKNWLVLIFMILAGCGILAYSMRDQNIHLIMLELSQMNWGWFLVAIVCICLYMGLEGVVDKIFIQDRYPDFSWKDALRLPPIEQLFNGITPFST